MKHLVAAFALLALGACKEDLVAKPQPVELTAEAVGYYCQMELLEHAGPKGQVHLDGMPAPVFFSQVRDAIAYLHMPEQSHAVRATYVQDMSGATWDTPGEWIAAEDAVYVLGSGLKGGMGAPEIVPFSDHASARAFARLHGGEVRPFDKIGFTDVQTSAGPEPEGEDDVASRLSALKSGRGTN